MVVAALAWRWNRGELAWVAEEELAAVAGELSLLALVAIFITSALAQIVRRKHPGFFFVIGSFCVLGQKVHTGCYSTHADGLAVI